MNGVKSASVGFGDVKITIEGLEINNMKRTMTILRATLTKLVKINYGKEKRSKQA